jgi:hypothetical protein
MKKVYIKPEMQEHQIGRRNLLVGSVKGVYGKIDGQEVDNALIYKGYITEEEEEEIDPE